jgi:hypothetical protein
MKIGVDVFPSPKSQTIVVLKKSRSEKAKQSDKNSERCNRLLERGPFCFTYENGKHKLMI